ncbi:hypothetical protein AGLY_012173 [Aphis glycines]|uniref:HAT C-terminal dimerisation domain-containing protein n=1 Tax=Aphis glycines TaxID=307491 RepID=A0A6G0TBG4_APHGL|nr:hypothetical protein AGLY_012173 [Aphis glycines]
MAEGGLALFIAAHCSILSCDHLGVLCAKQIQDSEAGKGIKMHNSDIIADQPYSILIDESTDISVLKFLGVTIMYFDRQIGKIMSTYLSLVEMQACDADAITDEVCKTIEEKGLDITKIVGFGSDNASVMVGMNNGVYKKLKEKVPSLIPCVCHSLKLAVSAATSAKLPRNIDHSTLRQAQYKNVYNAMNNGHNPLKIVKACDTSSIAKRFVNPYCKEHTLTFNMDSYTSPNLQWPLEFTMILEKSNSSEDEKKQLKERLVHFLQILLKQLQQRLPKNVVILEKVSMMSVKNTLKLIKKPLTPLLNLLKFDINKIDKINHQWQNLTNIKWIEQTNTTQFWKEVSEYTDASGLNPYFDVSSVALQILILPWSNADVERLFSQMNVVKPKLRNRMGPKLLNSILTIRAGLKREEMCCSKYVLPADILNSITKSYITPSQNQNQGNEGVDDNMVELMDIDVDCPILF